MSGLVMSSGLSSNGQIPNMMLHVDMAPPAKPGTPPGPPSGPGIPNP